MFPFFFALFFTIIIEFLIASILVKKGRWEIFSALLLTNAFTLPLATYLYSSFPDRLLPIELGVFVAEMFLYQYLLNMPRLRAFTLSLIANGITALIGMAFF